MKFSARDHAGMNARAKTQSLLPRADPCSNDNPVGASYQSAGIHPRANERNEGFISGVKFS
jgi:hypothetical protein